MWLLLLCLVGFFAITSSAVRIPFFVCFFCLTFLLFIIGISDSMPICSSPFLLAYIIQILSHNCIFLLTIWPSYIGYFHKVFNR